MLWMIRILQVLCAGAKSIHLLRPVISNQALSITQKNFDQKIIQGIYKHSKLTIF